MRFLEQDIRPQLFSPDAGVSGNGANEPRRGFAHQQYLEGIPDTFLKSRLSSFLANPLFGISEAGLSFETTAELLESYTGNNRKTRLPILDAKQLIRRANTQGVILLHKNPRERGPGVSGDFCDRVGLVSLGALFSHPSYVDHLQKTLDFLPVVLDLRELLGVHEIASFFDHLDIPDSKRVEGIRYKKVAEVASSMVGVIDPNSPLAGTFPVLATAPTEKVRQAPSRNSSSQRSTSTDGRYNDKYASKIPKPNELTRKLMERSKRDQ